MRSLAFTVLISEEGIERSKTLMTTSMTSSKLVVVLNKVNLLLLIMPDLWKIKYTIRQNTT